MANVTFIEQYKKFQKALEEIANPDWKECQNYIMAFEKAQRIAENALSSMNKSFYVLKQFDGAGPIFILEISSETLQIVDKEIINGIPEGWSSQDFYELLEEGNRLDVKLKQAT